MNVTSKIILALVLNLFVASTVRSFGESNEPQSLAVVVRSASGIEPAILKRALREAARLYRQGDVLIEWRDGAVGPVQGQLYLIVTPRDTVRIYTPQPALGTTPREPGSVGRISYVFVEAIEALAVAHGVDTSQVLGAAIAHEICHLLLPGRPHSQEGLMRASWSGTEARAANRGILRFLPSDFAAMRSRLSIPSPPLLVAGGRPGQP